MAAIGGKVFWELRVVEAGTSFALVGFAGTNFRCGQQAQENELLGWDERAWVLGNGSEDQCDNIHRFPPLSDFSHLLLTETFGATK